MSIGAQVKPTVKKLSGFKREDVLKGFGDDLSQYSSSQPSSKYKPKKTMDMKIGELANGLWDFFDADGLGYLAKKDAKKFSKDIFTEIKHDMFKDEEFEIVFEKKNQQGVIRKLDIKDFIVKLKLVV